MKKYLYPVLTAMTLVACNAGTHNLPESSHDLQIAKPDHPANTNGNLTNLPAGIKMYKDALLGIRVTVGNIIDGDDSGYCTASAIAPNKLLTAAHCFDRSIEKWKASSATNNKIKIYRADGTTKEYSGNGWFGSTFSDYQVSYIKSPDGNNYDSAHDMAVVTFKTNIFKTFIPNYGIAMDVEDVFNNLSSTSSIISVGWGAEYTRTGEGATATNIKNAFLWSKVNKTQGSPTISQVLEGAHDYKEVNKIKVKNLFQQQGDSGGPAFACNGSGTSEKCALIGLASYGTADVSGSSINPNAALQVVDLAKLGKYQLPNSKYDSAATCANGSSEYVEGIFEVTNPRNKVQLAPVENPENAYDPTNPNTLLLRYTLPLSTTIATFDIAGNTIDVAENGLNSYIGKTVYAGACLSPNKTTHHMEVSKSKVFATL